MLKQKQITIIIAIVIISITISAWQQHFVKLAALKCCRHKRLEKDPLYIVIFSIITISISIQHIVIAIIIIITIIGCQIL